MEHIVFEVGLAIALIAIAGFISIRLRFSIVPFYILVGMAVGPTPLISACLTFASLRVLRSSNLWAG